MAEVKDKDKKIIISMGISLVLLILSLVVLLYLG